MSDVWTPLLASLPLSRMEKEAVKRFSTDPTGRGFLPVADILRTHQLLDESLELLMQGVVQHPRFTVARVVLVRELVAKGLVGEAWRILNESPDSLRDNVLAQKLRFKLALLLGDEATAKATLQHMKLQQMHDGETKKLADVFEITGFAAARGQATEAFVSRGVSLTLPPPAAAATASTSFEAAPEPAAPPKADAPQPLSSYLSSDLLAAEATLTGFHVVPLAEIFQPTDAAGGAREGVGIELDSTTLAEIYVRQEHYGKALAIYRRLLRLSPGSDLLRQKVAELAKLEKQQRDVDLSIDPHLVDRMETIEIIDRQMRFYNDLLSRLA